MKATDISKMLVPVYTAVLSITFLETVIIILPREPQVSVVVLIMF